TGVVRVEGSAYPLLLSPEFDPTAPVVGYFEVKNSIGVERAFGRVSVLPTYNLQFDRPFTYSGPLDQDLVPVVTSYIDVLAKFDLRDDPIHPTAGWYFQADAQLGGGPLFGDASDVRIQPEARTYLALPHGLVLAFRGTIGFLFPF